jgi:molecular chaperone IbpA
MRSITTLNSQLDEVFRELNRYAVGFEPTFRMLDKVRNTITDSYPPYDLEKLDNERYRLHMAVAGFSADDIEITLQNGVLEIVGNADKDTAEKVFLHKGIASRNFKRTFYLNAWVNVTNTSLIDGILTLDFQQELPESMKPKKITIDTKPSNT